VAEGAAAVWELVAAGAATMLLPGRPRMGHGGEEWRRLLERTRGQSSPPVVEQRRTPPPPRAPSPRSSRSREPTAGVDAREDAASHWNPWFVWGKFASLSFPQKRCFADAERLCAVDSFMQEKG
jgi:hypothetical protein